MKLVGYVRVSTVGQASDGGGLEIQEDAIRRWVADNHHRLVGVYTDAGVSGASDERDGLADALAAISFNGAEGLVVHTLDRLARSLHVQEGALAKVWAADGRVFTVDGGEVLANDPEDPMRTFVRQVLGSVNELERAMIARRMRRGRQHKADGGGYAYGSPPYGYRAADGELVEDPDEQAVITRMRQMRAEGASLRVIADTLNGEQVAPKRGARWWPQTIARVLDRT